MPVADDGLCGPLHNNATCLGTAKQCCNSITWKCGDTAYVLSDERSFSISWPIASC